MTWNTPARSLPDDIHINRKRFEIEISIMVLIATQQPIAHDLRMLAASLNICTELERMGDYAKGIATYQSPLRRAEPAPYRDGYLFHGRKSGGYAPPGHDGLCR